MLKPVAREICLLNELFNKLFPAASYLSLIAGFVFFLFFDIDIYIYVWIKIFIFINSPQTPTHENSSWFKFVKRIWPQWLMAFRDMRISKEGDCY